MPILLPILISSTLISHSLPSEARLPSAITAAEPPGSASVSESTAAAGTCMAGCEQCCACQNAGLFCVKHQCYPTAELHAKPALSKGHLDLRCAGLLQADPHGRQAGLIQLSPESCLPGQRMQGCWWGCRSWRPAWRLALLQLPWGHWPGYLAPVELEPGLDLQVACSETAGQQHAPLMLCWCLQRCHVWTKG